MFLMFFKNVHEKRVKKVAILTDFSPLQTLYFI